MKTLALIGLTFVASMASASEYGVQQRALANKAQAHVIALKAKIQTVETAKATNLKPWSTGKVQLPCNVAAQDKQYADQLAGLNRQLADWTYFVKIHTDFAMEDETRSKEVLAQK